MAPYITRVVDNELDELAHALPALVLEGAKGVGKTATALKRASTAYRLDEPALRDIIQADPTRLLGGNPPVLIDEWQNVPECWDLVRRAVDDGAPAGRYLLTGSTSGLALPTHSGAGRIVTVKMRPLTLAERGVQQPSVSLKRLLQGDKPPLYGTTLVDLQQYAKQIVQTGFPGLRHLQGRALRAQVDSYLNRIAEHDFPDMGLKMRNPAALRRWMRAYAAASSTVASYETIRDAATGGQGDKPAKTTTQPYRDILERLHLIDPVVAWRPTHNRLARLSSPPKHQLADPGLAARLLGVDADALMGPLPGDLCVPKKNSLLGNLFEALVTLDVRVAAQMAECSVGHLRTAGGEREVDLIVERGDGRILAIEVKLGRRVLEKDFCHLLWLRDKLGADMLDGLVVTTGEQAYRRRDGIAVVPAALLGP